MKAIVEKYVQIWNAKGIPDLGDILNETSTYWDATQEGDAIDVLAGSIAATHEGFSEINFKINALNGTSTGHFFLEWRMTGVHTGSFFGFPPTGKRIDIEGLDSIKLESNRIKEIKSYYDSSLFGRQLGLV